MQWAFAILAVAVLGVAAIAATGRLGFMPPVVDDTPAPYIPLGDIDSAALREVRFTVETRGYSMRQVDALLAQIARQMEARDGVDRPVMQVPESGADGGESTAAVTGPAVRDNRDVAVETDRSI